MVPSDAVDINDYESISYLLNKRVVCVGTISYYGDTRKQDAKQSEDNHIC
jgi:hypothetical protein